MLLVIAIITASEAPAGSLWGTLGGATLHEGVAVQAEIQTGLSESVSGGPDIGAVAIDARIFFALTPRIDLAFGGRVAGIPAIGAGPIAELRVGLLERTHFALALDEQVYTAFLAGDAGVISYNISFETGVSLSTFLAAERWEVFYGAMMVTHILVSDVVSAAGAARLGFAYRFSARGQSLFYHMALGTPVYDLWGGRRDSWGFLPLIRVAVGVTL